MDKEDFSNIILGDHPSKRDKWFELLKDPVWVPKYNVSLNETREDAYKQLKKVTD